MGAPAIEVDRVGKRYTLGRRLSDADTLRDQVALWFRPSQRRADRDRRELWALRGVSFALEPGNVLGVIGRNGAGKTTLFKVLARITEPTEGTAIFRGRLASLLEVGTGFHTELTGRENIYLNGAILGMSRAEVRRRFDEIVAFAGVERFVDTPVKRYSSGMFVRLAFAVGAHLEADVLLVDEVLAVGDVEFQQRCLGKMRAVASEGRTVLFVSHNMQAVRTLCTRALLLDGGQLFADGPVDEVVRRYLDAGRAEDGALIPESLPRLTGTGEAFVRRVEIVDRSGRPVDRVFFAQPFSVRILCRAAHDLPDVAVEVGISTRDGIRVATFTSLDRGREPFAVAPGWWQLETEVDLVLQPGEYGVDVALHHWVQSKQTIDWIEQGATLRALDVPESGADHYVHFATRYNLAAVRGYVRPSATWANPRGVEPSEDGDA
jgi:lipopolysaccharide transport system ATP-binding protein